MFVEKPEHSAIQIWYYINKAGHYESWIFLSMLKKSAIGNTSWDKE